MEAVSLKALASVSPREFADILAGPPERAAAWVAAAADNGIVDAQAVYGQYLLDGHGVARDPAAAFNWFRHAARAGHAMAMNMLGRCYEFGWGTAACAPVAVYWYRLAAQAGLDWGMYNYATALALGNGVDENRADALDWFQRAAALGHAKSINLIGGFYEDGWVVPVDPDAAFDHYRRAAVAGDFRGQFNLARLLAERGRIDEALAWLARVPATATPAFVAKMHAYLASSPLDAFRAAAMQFQPQLQPHCMESAS
ncbi:Sel1 domain-containing protein [Burkholderia lata]|uniref:tetratricopeptide repeat protein n=1 Tax=Burkholderia lata (strain ATCC 17760 / DSM 23089 / LMG 22485 / NCIMB 9086 / R18194 / 383) TaxID=482957 RepID=UPI0014539314|nr:tetratricopeptide repeat protein [Burkholderia lata]VWD44673.1 Sel1 domain-containing protein [Burkholderia lata]